MDTPDENGYVADDYRITYLEAHIKVPFTKTGLTCLVIRLGAVSIRFQLAQGK